MITTFTRLNIVKEMFSLHFYYDCFYTARLRVYYMLNLVECRKRMFAGLKIWSAVEHIECAKLSKLNLRVCCATEYFNLFALKNLARLRFFKKELKKTNYVMPPEYFIAQSKIKISGNSRVTTLFI